MKVKPWLMSTALNNVQPIQMMAKVTIRRSGVSHLAFASFNPVKRSTVKKIPGSTPCAISIQMALCFDPLNPILRVRSNLETCTDSREAGQSRSRSLRYSLGRLITKFNQADKDRCIEDL